MITLETLAAINADLDSYVLEDSRPEKVQLPTSEAANVKLKSHQNEPEVNLPGQIEENLSEPSTINSLPLDNRRAIQLSNSNENDEKPEDEEKKEIYEKCMLLFRFLTLTLGITMTLDWKPHKHFLAYMMLFTEGLTCFSVTYTVFMHCYRGNYVEVLEPLAVAGLTASCALKEYGFLMHWDKIIALIFAIRKYFGPNIYGRQAEILKSSLQRTWTLLCIFSIGVTMAVTFYALTPIMVYIAKREIIPLMSIDIFFLDDTTTTGFYLTTLTHFTMGSYSAVVSILYGATMIFCLRNYILLSDLIAVDIEDLNEMWNGENNIPVAYKHAFLKNICTKRQDMNNFLDEVKYVFETKLFFYFCFNYFSQIICLYEITQNDWIGGYGPLLGLFLEMMFYCYLGTQVAIVDDNLCHTIYNSNWNSYDLLSQRIICSLLHEAQQDKDLSLGVIGPLNLVTGVVIVKSIYSYYTVLTEMV